MGAALSACRARTAPQIPSQKGKCPWVAYMMAETRKNALKCPPTARSARQRAAWRGSPTVGTSRRKTWLSNSGCQRSSSSRRTSSTPVSLPSRISRTSVASS